LEEVEWVQIRYDQLSFIDEKRLAAVCHGQLYHPRMFCEGDLVVKKIISVQKDHRGK